MQKAKIVTGTTPSGKRTILGEVLPLETPFLVQIFPVYACNFKCGYCLHSLPREHHGYVSDKHFMDINLYKKCIDDMSLFGNKLKMLRFAGIGEPLIHKDIAEMISYAKKRNIADSVEIVTNGVLLNNALSLSLINAGLDKLRISIQGVSSEKYQSISNAVVDLNEFVKNLQFIYKQRKNTRIYIKVIDCALSNKEEEIQFFEMFGDVCDDIAIEHLTPTVKGIDYAILADGKELQVTQSGNSLFETSICPQPFYMMQINPDGSVVPCCSMAYPAVFRDSTTQSIPEIWNGKEFSQFRRNLLEGTEHMAGACSTCSLYKYGLFPEDILDPYLKKLKAIF